MNQRFIIYGSYGEVDVDAEGMTVGGRRGPQHNEPGIPDEYSDILRYDVSEYRDYLKEFPKENPNAEVLHVDCLYICFWYMSKETGKKEYCHSAGDCRDVARKERDERANQEKKS